MSAKRTVMLSVRLTEREREILWAVAEAEGMDPSELVREAILARVWGGRDGEVLPRGLRPLRLHDMPTRLVADR